MISEICRDRAPVFADDPPVGEHQDPVGVRGGDRIVGDHRDALTVFVSRGGQQRQYLTGSAGIESAGRFVGEDDRRTVRKCPHDGDPLLLPAGQFCRPVIEALTQAENTDQVGDPRLLFGGDRVSGQDERQFDVLVGPSVSESG